MKKAVLIISYFILPAILLFVNSCNSEMSSEVSSLPRDSVTIAKGKNSFTNLCAGCHNFNLDGIGPQLAGVTAEHPVDWIKNFIRNPKKVIDSGDTSAQKLFKQYKAIMPSFEYLPDEEI